MSHSTEIYGAIFCFVGGSSTPEFMERIAQNLYSLERLPAADEYPPLTRNLFTVSSSSYNIPGLYKKQVIHFGGSFKDMNEQWDIWLDKFESVLKILVWSEAYLHLHFDLILNDQTERKYFYQWRFKDTPKAQKWDFKGGPREFGCQVERFRKAEKVATKALRTNPNDGQALKDLIVTLSRLKKHDQIWDYYEQLKNIDSDLADTIPTSNLIPWAQYVGLV